MSSIHLQYLKNPKVAPNWRARGTLSDFFNIHCCKTLKQLKGDPLGNFFSRKKSHNAESGPFGIFQYPFCHKTPKKLKGTLLWKKLFGKKSSTIPKKTEMGTLQSRTVLYDRRKNGKTILVQFPGPTGTI